MQKGQKEYAQRKALELFDAWNDVTGCFPKFTSYYYEICAVINDAVEIGSMVALGVPLRGRKIGQIGTRSRRRKGR